MKKKILSCLLACLLLFTFNGCNTEIKQTNEELTVYVGPLDRTMNSAVQLFRHKYPDIKLNVTNDLITSNSSPDADSMYNAMQAAAADIMAGKGADVFLIQGFWDYDKVAESGSLLDLNEYYEQKLPSLPEVNHAIMDAGLRREKRLAIPLAYYIPLLASGKDTLENANFAFEGCTDFIGFLDETEKYIENPDNTANLFYDQNILSQSFIFSGINPISFENQAIDLSSEQLKRYFEWFRDMSKKPVDLKVSSTITNAAEIRDGKTLVVTPTWGYFGSLISGCRAIKTFDEPVIFPVRNLNGGITAEILESIAVRSNTPNRENAYKLIDILLSEEFYATFPYNYDDYSIFTAQQEEYFYPPAKSSTFGQSIEGFPVECPEFTQEEYDIVKGYIGQIDSAIIRTGSYAVLRDSMRPFIDGEMSYEECLSSAEEELKLYFTE